MPDDKTRGASVHWFYTGASSHDGAQSDPNASLGNHKSSTRIPIFTVNRASPIANITVDFVAGANGPGDGTLIATGVDTVTWTPPGGSVGAAVTILNGETEIVEGADTDQWIEITRTSATDLTGTETDTLADSLNNIFDDVTSAEQAAGDIEYRCICFEVMSAAEVKDIKVRVGVLGTQQTSDGGQLPASGAGTIQTTGSFADWPAVGFVAIYTSGGTEWEIVYYTSRTDAVLTVPAAGRALLGTSAAAGSASDTVDAIPGIALGLDAPTSQPAGAFVDNTGAGEGSAPGGVTFATRITDADADAIGDLVSTYIYAVWIKRQITVGAIAQVNVLKTLELLFDAA